MALPPFLVGDDLLKFRTRHCQRFVKQGYCNFADKCQYSHNIEWTRRPLWKYNYTEKLCDFVRGNPCSSKAERSQNICGLHRQCPLAHSYEEQVYHPKVYKRVLCQRYIKNQCPRYYCPFAHGVSELQGTELMDGNLLSMISLSQDTVAPIVDFSSNHTDYLCETQNKKPPCDKSARNISNWPHTSSESFPTYTVDSLDHIANEKQKQLETLFDSTMPPSYSDVFDQNDSLLSHYFSKNKSNGNQSLTNKDNPACYLNLEIPPYPDLLNVCDAEKKIQKQIHDTLDNDLKPFEFNYFEAKTLKCFELSIRAAKTNYEWMVKAYVKLSSFSKCHTFGIGHVFLTPLTFDSGDQYKKSQTSCLSFVSDTPLYPDWPLQNTSVTMSQIKQGLESLTFTLQTVQHFLKSVEALHQVGFSHNYITPWILVESSLTKKSNIGQLLYGALPLLTNRVNLSYLICQSPEVLQSIMTRKQTVIEKSRTLSADVWSCGVCMFLWISENHCHPFGNTLEEIFHNIFNGITTNLNALWKDKFPLLFHLLNNMITMNPMERISLKQALQHPVFWPIQSKKFYCHLLSTVLLLSPSATENITLPIGWLQKIVDNTFNNDSLHNSFQSLMQLFKLPFVDMWIFVRECLDFFVTMFPSIPLQHDMVTENHIIKELCSQSSLGLVYFLCLIYAHDEPLHFQTSEIVSSFSKRFPEALLNIYTFIWQTHSKQVFDPFSFVLPSYSSNLNVPTNQVLQDFNQPKEPALLRLSSAMMEDVLDGESTTASSTCPPFVQSVLSFMEGDT